MKYVDGKAKVVNGLGEFYFVIDADRRSGVIDMYAGPTEAELALFPTRVVPLGEDRSAYSFTMFKAPGMPDELFERDPSASTARGHVAEPTSKAMYWPDPS